jgi:DNA ligase-1
VTNTFKLGSRKRPLEHPKSTQAAAKTPRVENASEEDDEDDEPISKKHRRSIRTGIRAIKEPTELSEQERAKLAEELEMLRKAFNEERNTTTKICDLERKLGITRSEDNQMKTKVKHESDDDNEAPARISEHQAALQEDSSDEPSSASDDEKPEDVAKARENVQTTLKSKSKDPYPDWEQGDPVPYAALCTTFSLVELTPNVSLFSRIARYSYAKFYD